MNKKKILFADDHPGEQMFMAQVLDELGNFDVTICEDGQEAITLLEDGTEFYAVITDFNMPYKNGGEVARAARERGVELIMVRSSENLATLEPKIRNEYELGGDVEVISKRIETHELKAALRDILKIT